MDSLPKSYSIEFEIFEQHHHSGWILGVDEVGRGSLAGPIVAACCAIQVQGPFHPKVQDSKKLSAKRRCELYRWIKTHHLISIQAMSHLEIDQLGMGFCNPEVIKRAVARHRCSSEGQPILKTLVDGNFRFQEKYAFRNVIKGDQVCYSIGCASIVAKHVRDYFMQRLGRRYPDYGFDNHMGYGTQKHMAAIQKHGLSAAHRKTFCQGILTRQSTIF